MKIFLIGMPGAGKSTIGQQLSRKLVMDFVDLDHLIEESENMSIADIFAKKGEPEFRLVESRLLKMWAGNDASFVMATGGGAPYFHNGIEIINQVGLSIFLDEPINVLLDRVKDRKDRPLLNAADVEETKQRLEKIRETRLSCYQKANVTVQSASLSKVLEAINFKR